MVGMSITLAPVWNPLVAGESQLLLFSISKNKHLVLSSSEANPRSFTNTSKLSDGNLVFPSNLAAMVYGMLVSL